MGQGYADGRFGTILFAFADVATFQAGSSSPNQTVTQGGSAAFPITTQSDFGYSQPINFDANVMGLPAGAQASFAPAGTYELTLTANSGLINRYVKVNLTVNPQPFTLTISPSSRTVLAGQPAIYTVNVNAAGGFSGPVQLSGPAGLPPGTSASFSPSTVTGTGSSTLTVTTSTSTPGGLAHSQVVTLTVGPPVADTTPPTVSSTSPTAGAANVAVTASTITAANVELRTGGSLVSRTVTYDPATNRATLTASLTAGTIYTVTVKSGVSDVAGNNMTADHTFSFTTVSSGQILGYDQIGSLLDNGDTNYMNGSRFVTGASGAQRDPGVRLHEIGASRA